jgi:hypothetical protein
MTAAPKGETMSYARFAIIGLLVASGCMDAGTEDGEPQGADEAQTGTLSQELSSDLTIGTTLQTTDYLNLRTGPSTGDAIIEVIPPGTRVSTVYRTTPSAGFYNIVVGTKVGWSSGLYLAVASPPVAHMLDTSVVAKIVEPPGDGHDDHGTYYSDQNYWNFCSPGAVTAALSYFTSNVTAYPAGYVHEPYGPHESTTYWASSDSVDGYATVGRAYLMHIALAVKPPNFTSAGLPSFGTYPTHGSSLHDSRDVLNWEASGHSSSWSTFFYQDVSASGLSSATLHHDITRDIWGGHAVFADVNTAYLPNWSRGLGHSIAIVGYDDTAGTYTYVDTCGHRCNGSSQSTNGGVWHVSQSRMYSAILALGAGYAR